MSALSFPERALGPVAALGDVEAIIEYGGPQLRARMAGAERRLCEFGADATAPLAVHAAQTIAAGGKRLRPLLVFLAAQAAGDARAADAPDERREEALIAAAVAVELVHSATLVHDDILDGARLRRGRPTVVAAGGRMMAVAAGDLLFARAFAELARNGSSAQLRALSDASSALAAGELLQREDAYRIDVALERYLTRCELKTARLFEAACRLGSLVARGRDSSGPAVGAGRDATADGAGRDATADGADRDPTADGGEADGWADALGAYGRRVGLAFQMLDDVLDVSGPASRTGKHRGTDLLDGTVTLPLILAREQDAQLARLDLRRLSGAAAAEAVCERIESTGALAAARSRALSIVSEAKRGLPAALGEAQRRLLERVADAVVERYT